MSKENTIKIWKDNKLDEEVTITFQEIIKQFKKSDNWENYIFTSMSLEEALSLFMDSSCIYKDEDFQELLSFLKLEIKKQYIGE